MAIKEFFTIPDPDISQESSVDPMGIQVIWTYYGQAIFNEKLTTIANDLRVFTFNLFHNHVINQLFKNYPEQIQQAKNGYKTWTTEAEVKTGILMFLEDMVTWTFFFKDDISESNVDKLGILGLTKARTLWNSINEDQIFLGASKRSGLLKNQINLGMTGRYKGPMINMEFIDRSFCYIPKTWEHVDKFMGKWMDAIELEAKITKLLTDVLFKANQKDFPRITLSELKRNKLYKDIREGYVKCFGSKKLPKDIRQYWKDKLGLLSGAPKALFDQIALINDEDYMDHSEIFSLARNNITKETEELNKIDTIIKIEPFLSHSEYLLRFVSQHSIKKVEDIEKDLLVLRGKIKSTGNFNISNPHPRLLELMKAMLSEGSLLEWLERVLAFHTKVMENRGGNRWVELDGQYNFKHYFGVPLRQDLNTIPKYLHENIWWHTYYLETVRNIHIGLN